MRKEWSPQQAMLARLEKEDWVEWAVSPHPYELKLGPDTVSRQEKPPLYAVITFARGCMP
jgi:hypothetical protein